MNQRLFVLAWIKWHFHFDGINQLNLIEEQFKKVIVVLFLSL